MKKVYLDVNIYNRPFDDQSQVRIRLETISIFSIMQRIKKRELLLVWSFIIDYENSLNPYDDVRQEVDFLSSIVSKSILPSDTIVTQAMKFESMGIKPRDALHVACALEAGADYFLTCDDKLINKASSIRGLKILNPIRFIEETEVS
jgi:predicted nucleic acid-binding protein